MALADFVQLVTQYGPTGVLAVWLWLERADKKSAEAENGKLVREIVTLGTELKSLSATMLGLLGKQQ
jgi:hypothetical protein